MYIIYIYIYIYINIIYRYILYIFIYLCTYLMLLYIYICKVSTLLVPVCESISKSLWCAIVCDSLCMKITKSFQSNMLVSFYFRPAQVRFDPTGYMY